MPRQGYNFLSDREREYLNSPDQFDSQRAAELSYRIRQKTVAAVDDLELLRATAKVWDKTEEIATSEFVCWFTQPDAGPDAFDCSSTIEIDGAVFVSESLDETLTVTPDGWLFPRQKPGEIRFGVCPDCRKRAVEWFKETGRVPCGARGHRTHEPHSASYEECRVTLPLTDEEHLRPKETIGTGER